MIFDEVMNNHDIYFILKDFDSYRLAQEKIAKLYEDKALWAKMCINNISMSGFFSSDRTIEEYNRDIWHLERIGNLDVKD